MDSILQLYDDASQPPINVEVLEILCKVQAGQLMWKEVDFA